MSHHWIRHFDRRQFAAFVTPFLSLREAANNLQMGMVNRFSQGKGGSVRSDESVEPLMLSYEHSGSRQVAAVAIRTPPFPVVITDLSVEAGEALMSFIELVPEPTIRRLSGVVGPRESARRFAAAWTDRHGVPHKFQHAVGAYELTEVQFPPVAPGEMSAATMQDLDLLADWSEAFAREIHEPHDDGRRVVGDLIRGGRIFVWRVDGVVVSMAGLGGDTPNGVRVNSVYTPREHRGRGFASNLVAHVSRHALNSGRRFCFLFADNANPTSTGIYRRMGYKHVCDYENYRFVEDDAVAS